MRQPWAWAIIHGGKDVENRVRNIAGSYRGPVAIHCSLAEDESAMGPSDHPALNAAKNVWFPSLTAEAQWSVTRHPWREWSGHIIGVVDLVDVHRGHNTEDDRFRAVRSCYRAGKPFGPCSTWALPDNWHIELENPRALDEPIPFKGALGLRRLDEAMVQRIEAAIA